MSPPKIKIAGIRSSIPQGYILGRQSPGTGDVELIAVPGLGQGGGIPGGGGAGGTKYDTLVFSLGESEPVPTGDRTMTLRVPYRFRVVAVKASVRTVSTAGDVVLGLRYGIPPLNQIVASLTIPEGETTSRALGTETILLDTLGDDVELAVVVCDPGDAVGLKVELVGFWTAAALTHLGQGESVLQGVSQRALGGINIKYGSIVQGLAPVTQHGSLSLPRPPDYASPDGSGDRQLTVTYLGTASIQNGSPYALINGTTANEIWFGQGQHGDLIWDFHRPRVMTEATWRQSGATGQGTRQWRGSNDGVTWTDIGATFTLGAVATQVITELSANTTAYRLYGMFLTAGATDNSPFIQEITFKLDPNPIALAYYDTTYGSGDRTATITATWSVGLGGSLDLNDMLDGTRDNEVFFNNGSTTGSWIEWDFGSAVNLQEIEWLTTGTTPNGVWQMQGFNGTGYDNIGGPFVLGSTVFRDTIIDLSMNSTTYQVYRMLMVSGVTSNVDNLVQANFYVL